MATDRTYVLDSNYTLLGLLVLVSSQIDIRHYGRYFYILLYIRFQYGGILSIWPPMNSIYILVVNSQLVIQT